MTHEDFMLIAQTAKSLEPIAGTEYARGISELIARLLIEQGQSNECTGELAVIVSLMICEPNTKAKP